MKHLKPILPFLVFLFVFAGFSVQHAEAETIAIHPLNGENREMAGIFYDVLIMELFMFPVPYSAYAIDLDAAPPDVPPGGFPAYICPSPSITNGAPYAFTGEFFEDPDYPESYRLRLYLWNMKKNELLTYDELTAGDRESCEKEMRYLLAWLLSWIEKERTVEQEGEAALSTAPEVEEPVRDEPPEQTVGSTKTETPAAQVSAVWDPSGWVYTGPEDSGRKNNTTPLDNPNEWVYLGPEGEKWLYLGARGGLGSSQWYRDSGSNNGIADFWNTNIALQASVSLTRYFDIQTEANFSGEFGSLGDIKTGTLKDSGLFINWSLTVPVLAKLTLRANRLKASLFGGLHMYLPLVQTNSGGLGGYFDYEPDFPGFTFGTNIGWKMGPGYLFLDARLEYDGRWYSSGSDRFFYRNMTKINVGYELGFITKKSR